MLNFFFFLIRTDRRSGDSFRIRTSNRWVWYSTPTASFGCRTRISLSIFLVWKFAIWVPTYWPRNNSAKTPTRNGKWACSKANGSVAQLPADVAIFSVRSCVGCDGAAGCSSRIIVYQQYLIDVSETFSSNPQYRITLDDPDDEDEEQKCTVIIALMQKNRRAQRKIGAECLTIGFAVYQVTVCSVKLLLRPVACSKHVFQGRDQLNDYLN